jgi:hypothetical protein
MPLINRLAGLAATIVVGAAVNAVLVEPAFAYIDPGTGTMLLQVAGAMIAAGLFYLRAARLWVARLFGGSKPRTEAPRTDDGPESAK